MPVSLFCEKDIKDMLSGKSSMRDITSTVLDTLTNPILANESKKRMDSMFDRLHEACNDYEGQVQNKAMRHEIVSVAQELLAINAKLRKLDPPCNNDDIRAIKRKVEEWVDKRSRTAEANPVEASERLKEEVVMALKERQAHYESSSYVSSDVDFSAAIESIKPTPDKKTDYSSDVTASSTEYEEKGEEPESRSTIGRH